MPTLYFNSNDEVMKRIVSRCPTLHVCTVIKIKTHIYPPLSNPILLTLGILQTSMVVFWSLDECGCHDH